MKLGERLRAARLEAGLSQRQLCGGKITRNMLSQIENGSARPSMDTLRYLAGRLGKTVSFFLEEETAVSPNQAAMEQAQLAYLQEDSSRVLQALEGYREPDGIFDQEYRLLMVLACLNLAQQAADQGRRPYAAELLAQAEAAGQCAAYCPEELERRRLLLAARVEPQRRQEIVRKLPSLDEELLLRAQDVLERGDTQRSEQLLEAAEDKTAPEWNLLRGQTHLTRGQFTKAAVCFLRVEERYPEVCYPKLEQCYRELGNYEKAYEYACKQKK